MVQEGRMLKMLLSLAAKNVRKFVLPLLLQIFGRFFLFFCALVEKTNN